MALAYKFIIFSIFVISCFAITTTTITPATGTPATTTPYAFKDNGRINTGRIIVEPPFNNPPPSPSYPPVCPTLHEVTYNFSNVGLQTIGLEFIKSDDIISLILDNNNISKISQFAFRKMPNLRYLTLAGNRIPKEKLLSFNEIGRLEILIIDNNNDDSTVKDLQEYGTFNNLKHLYLRNSQLKDMQIPFNVITPALTNLYLSNNSITSNNVFDNIPWTLTHLYLDSNSIDEVEHDKLKYLKELNMNNNNIKKVCFECSKEESISLKSATNMQNLLLSENMISEVSSDALKNTRRLEILDLSNNKISNLDKDTFNNVLQIIELSLANNSLTTIPNICPILRLKFLNLAGNRIDTIKSNDFKCTNMRQLEYLYLSNNSMNTIESGAFFYLTKLKYLDLSGNHLKELPTQWAYINHYYFSYNDNSSGYNNYNSESGIEELHLERNNFISLDDISLVGINSLQHIYLDENPILTFRVNSFQHLKQHLTFHVKNMREKYADSLESTEKPNNADENYDDY